jgi:hypothetical protein
MIFLLLPATPMRAFSGRSRLMRDRFPTGTLICRSSKEAHALLGWRVCAYHERWALPQNSELSFEVSFIASPFVNTNTWHSIYNNFNFIWYCMLICVVFVYSHFTENPPIWSWEINSSFLRWFCHSWLSEQDWGKTHTKASKNHNNIIGEERLAHMKTIVVSLCGNLTYVFFYATTELHQWSYVVIFGVFILFCCWWPYFVICGLYRTITVCGCLILLFMRLFW